MSTATLFAVYISSVDRDRNAFVDEEDAIHSHSRMGYVLRVLLFLALFCCLFGCLGLTAFHLYLLCTNQTTTELMRPDIVDRYLLDEMERKREFDRKHCADLRESKQLLLVLGFLRKIKAEMDGVYIPHNIMIRCFLSVHGEEPRLPPNARSARYQYQYYGDTISSYKRYFDRGCGHNLKMVLSGKVQREWVTPIGCKLR